MSSFAYLFARFPSFTQTFCYREAMEMRRQGVTSPIYSIRVPDDIPSDCPEEIKRAVTYLPDDVTIVAEIKELRDKGRLQRNVKDTIARWGKRPDKLRAFTAAWLGPVLLNQGIGHVHVHFAGIAARTAYWLKKFHGITFSFTGHANDIFCAPDFPVTIEDLVQEAEFVITEANFSRDWLRARYPKFATKIHRVYNGIDVSLYPEPDPAPGKPHILSVGRCIEKKGFSDLIDACGILKNRGLDFECSIVGGGPLEESLRARVLERGLEGVVMLTGRKPQEEVQRLLASARLFVLACATEADGGMDNFPTVIVEAMASGLPIVSTRLAGVPEMVEHGVSGLLVGERDPAALAGAMAEILFDSAKGMRFGAFGKTLASERFDSQVTVKGLKNLLSTAASL